MARLTERLESAPLMTLRHELIQLDATDDHLLIATENDLMISPLGKVWMIFFV